MKAINQFSAPVLHVFALVLLLLAGGFGSALAGSSELSTAVFYVQ